jgi:citrate/tricarballylate utilization protein
MPFDEVEQKSPLVAEGQHAMAICNACRYCEGFCAVFPAMERRLSFAAGDLNYLANLCHNCGECYHACQYAPPHEFGINIPKTMAKIRRASYQDYAWPQPLAQAFARNGVVAASLTTLILTVAMAGAAILLGGRLFEAVPGGDFYALIPHGIMAGAFGGVSLLVLLALLIGLFRFWRDAGESVTELAKPFALGEALRDIAGLTYLHGNGAGCPYPGEVNSQARKWFHHATFYGFMLCFAATSVATFFHYGLGWHAPYSYFSLPVVLGTIGGIGLIVGPIGLLWLKRGREEAVADPAQNGMDLAFILLLIATSVSGLALLGLRESAALGITLILHLGIVMTLFVMLPYGKFVHGLYRGAALVKYALERRRPGLNLGGE